MSQEIFGLGRPERPAGIGILIVAGCRSLLWLSCSALGSSKSLFCWSSGVRITLGAGTCRPLLKQGRPLEGGGSDDLLHRECPAAPPGFSAGRDTRLCRRGGCSTRGHVAALDSHWAPNETLSPSVCSCREAPFPPGACGHFG